MRKVIRLTLLVGLLLALGSTGLAQAQGGLSYQSSFQIQNLEGQPANVVLQFYNQDGTVASSPNFQIGANSSRTFFTVLAELGLPSTFNGSLVVSSDRNVRAINNLNASGGYFATTNGFQAGATTVNLPLVMCNNSGFNTFFNVQNAGTGDAHITVYYNAGSAGVSTSETATIKQGAAKTFNQQAGSAGSKNCDQLKDATSQKFIGSARIESDQPVVAAVMQLNTTTFKVLMAYGGFPGAGSNNVVLPLLMANNNNMYTAFQIQNVSTSADAVVTIDYSPNTITSNAFTPAQESFTLTPGVSKTIFQAGNSPSNGSSNSWAGLGKYVGSATVSSTGGAVVVIVNQQLAVGKQLGSSYEGFNPADATNTISAPLMMANNSSYYTSMQIANVSTTADAVVTVNYTANTITTNPFTPDPESFTLTPGTSKTIIHASVPPTNGSSNSWASLGKYVGSATITSTGGQIVAIVNQQSFTAAGDQLASGDAFNYTPAP